MMMRHSFLIGALSIFSIVATLAQDLPASGIYLFEWEEVNDSTFLFDNPKFLSGYNLGGYNNQPHFVSTEELYVTVQMAGATNQTDLYSLRLDVDSLTQITDTPESEFSAALRPSRIKDEKGTFTAVRVENDGQGSQRLWEFPLDRSNDGAALFPDIKNVGYYQWIDHDAVAMFLVGEPHRLVVSDLDRNTTREIAGDIGRCLQPYRSDIVYLDKSRNNGLLKRLNTRFFDTSLITALLPNSSEDFTVLSDGTIISSRGASLYKFNQLKDRTWRKIADLGNYGVREITRMTANEKYLVLVVQ